MIKEPEPVAEPPDDGGGEEEGGVTGAGFWFAGAFKSTTGPFTLH